MRVPRRGEREHELLATPLAPHQLPGGVHQRDPVAQVETDRKQSRPGAGELHGVHALGEVCVRPLGQRAAYPGRGRQLDRVHQAHEAPAPVQSAASRLIRRSVGCVAERPRAGVRHDSFHEVLLVVLRVRDELQVEPEHGDAPFPDAAREGDAATVAHVVRDRSSIGWQLERPALPRRDEALALRGREHVHRLGRGTRMRRPHLDATHHGVPQHVEAHRARRAAAPGA